MRVAVVGSRSLYIDDLSGYLPHDTQEIVSGGAQGIDQCAAKYALEHNLILTEIKPDYRRYGKGAPLNRNIEIISYADMVIVFWDGKSHGSKFVINECKKSGKALTVYVIQDNIEQ